MGPADPSTAFTIREAAAAEAPEVIGLLTRNNQSAHAVLASASRYWIAKDGQGGLIGTIGLELGRDTALLRSAAVLAEWRHRGVGTSLTRHLLAAATQVGCRAVYLFSTGAGEFWSRLGFRQVPVPELVAALSNAPQVRQYETLGWLPTEVAWRCDLRE